MDSEATAEVLVPLSKTKTALLLFGAIAFVVGGICLWCIADKENRSNRSFMKAVAGVPLKSSESVATFYLYTLDMALPLFVKAVAVANVAFFGLCAIYASFKLFDTRPGLIIDSQGLVDNSSAVAAGRIPWEEIIGLKISRLAGQRFITIEVLHPHRFIEGGSFFSRMLNAGNRKMTGSPINISSNSLRLNFDQLVDVLTEAFEKHKGPSRTNG